MEGKYYTYVLYSVNFKKIYISYSSDYIKRLESHNDSRNSGWTRKYQPWMLVYLGSFNTKSKALKREKS